MKGSKFGRWTVIGDPVDVPGYSYGQKVLCECECGTKRMVSVPSLRKVGGSKSCGCVPKYKHSRMMISLFRKRLPAKD